MVLVLQDDVDDAGDGVRAVLSGGAVLQHFDVVDGADRDQAEVWRRCALEGAWVDVQVAGGMPALAVDQHQGVVGVQAAQCGGQGEVGGVAARGLGVEGRQVLGQSLDDVGLADVGESTAADNLDRRGAVLGLHAGLARAGDDQLAKGGASVGHGGVGCGGVGGVGSARSHGGAKGQQAGAQ